MPNFQRNGICKLTPLSVAGYALVISIVSAVFCSSLCAQVNCPSTPVVMVNSSQVPTDVCIPAGFGGNPIQYFDDYSWRTFIALVWPAASGQRGVPDAGKTAGDVSVPLVFETLKSDWEMFQPNGAPPSAWNDFSGKNPCGATVGFNDMILSSFTKFGNLGEAGGGGRQNPLIHALPSQNGKWVRYLTAFNQLEYTQIVNGKLYLFSALQSASPLTLQNGAIDIKSAWMDMTGLPDSQRARYYTGQALVQDPTASPGSACSKIAVGLVGLHIVQKTASRPQWIWTTFEQVDNVPIGGGGGPFGFNDGKGTASPLSPPSKTDPNVGFPPKDWSNPQIYNVIRIQPIAGSTQSTNAGYQKALAGTVWQFYQLVMTQWPLQRDLTKPIPPSQNGLPGNTFPGQGATSSFANTVLETWDQSAITTGCMACHTLTQGNSDFLWSLEINAFQPENPNIGFSALRVGQTVRPARSKAEQDLMKLLQSAQGNARTQKPSGNRSKDKTVHPQ